MMRRLLTLAVVCAVAAVAAPTEAAPTPRIVGGSEVGAGEFPFLVALVDASESSVYDGQFCGGALIHAEWVLTAAHCVVGETAATIDVYVGDRDLSGSGDRIEVTAVASHPEYDDATVEADVALLHLAEPVALSTVRLATGASSGRYAPGDVAIVAGWGNTESDPQYPDRAHKAEIPMRSTSDCEQFSVDFDFPHMVCAGYDAGGVDSCQGDSGGPLFVPHGDGTYLQVGIVSWGAGCAAPGTFGVYSRVATFACWIAETMATGTLGLGKTTTSGTPGPDVFVGTANNDIYLGLGGDDEIVGAGGDDVLCGGDGADTIWGGDGADVIDGGADPDLLHGENGADTVLGGSGTDTLVGHRGADGLIGGPEGDLVEGRTGSDRVDGSRGSDTLRGGKGTDVLRGGPGADDLRGGADDDDLLGGGGLDSLDGGPGTDSCDGESLVGCEL